MLWRGGVPWDELDFGFLGGSNEGHLVDLRKKHWVEKGDTAHTYRSFTFFYFIDCKFASSTRFDQNGRFLTMTHSLLAGQRKARYYYMRDFIERRDMKVIKIAA
jgi:hypothetical protein